MITVEQLKDKLNYNPETGVFTWKNHLYPKRNGAVAGTVNTDGYVVIRLFGILHYAHRLAWLFVHGELPENEIDHRNRVRSDNRFKNLRSADSSQNKFNMKMRRDNSVGFKGVCYFPDRRKFIARIKYRGNVIHLGYFPTAEQASAAYEAAADKYHGQFRRS